MVNNEPRYQFHIVCDDTLFDGDVPTSEYYEHPVTITETELVAVISEWEDAAISRFEDVECCDIDHFCDADVHFRIYTSEIDRDIIAIFTWARVDADGRVIPCS